MERASRQSAGGGWIGGSARAALVAVAAWCFMERARAATVDWITATGGSWAEPKNWSFGFVPRIADLARFGYRDATYEVTLDQSTSADALECARGAVTLSLLGGTLTLAREDANSAPGFRVADEAGQAASLSIVGPGRVTAWDASLAGQSGSAASLAVTDGARLSLFRDLTIGGGGQGTVLVGAGSRIAAQHARLLHGSTLAGVGVLAATLDAGGAISPGVGGVGALGIQGTAALAQSATLWIDLAPGMGGAGALVSDALLVSGAAALGGEVRVSLLQGAQPALGDSFTILSAGEVTGSFTGVTAPTLGEGLAFTIVYSPTTVTLTVVPGAPAWGVALVASVAARRRRPTGSAGR